MREHSFVVCKKMVFTCLRACADAISVLRSSYVVSVRRRQGPSWTFSLCNESMWESATVEPIMAYNRTVQSACRASCTWSWVHTVANFEVCVALLICGGSYSCLHRACDCGLQDSLKLHVLSGHSVVTVAYGSCHWTGIYDDAERFACHSQSYRKWGSDNKNEASCVCKTCSTT